MVRDTPEIETIHAKIRANTAESKAKSKELKAAHDALMDEYEARHEALWKELFALAKEKKWIPEDADYSKLTLSVRDGVFYVKADECGNGGCEHVDLQGLLKRILKL